MRIVLRSEIDEITLDCWYEIPCKASDAFIEDLIRQLHWDLGLQFPIEELGLQLKGFDLLRRSKIRGVLRDDDIISLRHLTQSGIFHIIKQSHNQLEDHVGIPDRSTVLQEPHGKMSAQETGKEPAIAVSNCETESRSDPAPTDPVILASEFLAIEEHENSTISTSTPGSESGSDSDTGSSSSDTSASSNSSQGKPGVSSVCENTDTNTMTQGPPWLAKSQGIPFAGKTVTSTRNARRARQRTLRRLVEAGTLPPGSDFKTLDLYLNQSIGGNSQPQIRPPVGQIHVDAHEVWDYPDEPEQGWERRLIVKEVECEDGADQREIPVKQFQESEERLRKRRKPNSIDSSLEMADVHQESNNLTVDIYDDSPVISKGPIFIDESSTETAEEGEAEECNASPRAMATIINDLEDDSIDLPHYKDVITTEFLEPTSYLLSKPGTVIAFKHMELRNFQPVLSAYKTAKIIESDGEELTLELAKRDRDEQVYDYDGDRIPALFEVLDQDGEPIEGRIALPRGDLMDILLVRS